MPGSRPRTTSISNFSSRYRGFLDRARGVTPARPEGVRARLWSKIRSGKGGRWLLGAFANKRKVDEALSPRKNIESATSFIVEHVHRVRQPLVLISQVERSGGSLLSQLFDGHPQIFAHPHEVKLGYPSDETWVPLDPKLGARKNFLMLFEHKNAMRMRFGYTKGERDPNRHPYFFFPGVQYRVFQHLFETHPPAGQRDILNHYFTSYFNAWLNYSGLEEDKRWITAFAPRLANYENNVTCLFENYPDGRLIQIIRDPKSWYASARNHRGEKSRRLSIQSIMRMWIVSAKAMLRNKVNYPNRVIVLKFEDLIQRTNRTMEMLAAELQIEFDPRLTQPTHNGGLMRANSSFAVESAGVIERPALREEYLNEEERGYIEQRAGRLYLTICDIAGIGK